MTGINRIPLGYLDMVGTKTGGKNPYIGLETVQPNIDMTPFYHAYAMTTVHQSWPVAGLGDVENIFVPDEEIWFLYGVGLKALWLLGTDRLKFSVSLKNLNDALFPDPLPIFTSPLLDRAGTDQQSNAGTLLPMPVPMVAGTAITFTAEFVVGVPATFAAMVTVAKFAA